MSNQVEQLEMTPATKVNVLSNPSIGKIIVVDDEPELKSVLVKALSAQGFEVTGCSGGHEALAQLRQKEFDLLLTDLMMPEMDGIALLEAALKIDPHLIGIMMTGQGTIQTAVDAMKIGAFDYVLKPFRLQMVMPVLTRAINTRRLRMENLQLRETVAIYGLCQTISFTLEPQTVLSKLADAALQQSDADEVSILLPTADGKELFVAAVRGEKRERLLGERIPLQESISSWVARERTPLILNGEVHDERFVALWPRPEIRSAVSVPMQVANKLVGVINLNVTNRLRSFTLGQMKALTILASTAAAALESASLYSRVQQAEEKYRSIFDNAVEGVFQSTPEGKFLTVNPSMARILGYESPAEMIATITDITHQFYVDPQARAEGSQIQEERGLLHGFEFEAYRKNGEKIWLSANRRSVWHNDIEIYREGSVEDITERKRAEEVKAQLNAEIRQQRERLNTIVASVPGIVFESWRAPDALVNGSGFVSEYVEAMLGYTVAEWLSSPQFWLSIVYPEDRERVTQEAAAQFESCKNGEFEFRWISKDNRIVWVSVHTTIVCGEGGKALGVRGVAIDITERRRAEAALRESEGRYRDLVENAHDLIYEHDLQGNYTAANKAGEQITGYSLEESLKLNLQQTVAPEYRDKAQQMLSRKLAGEKVTAYELEIIAKDGHRVAVEVNSRLVLKDGVPVGVQGIARDITERKLAEAGLRESEERYRLLFESSPQPMWVYDLETLAFLAVNESAVQHYGYSREEFLGMTIKDIRPTADISALHNSVAKGSEGFDVAGIWRHLKKDGTIIEVEITSHLLVFDGRKAELILAHDITERNRLQAALLESEDQLRQSQKLEAIGQLAGGVAHDFNNLLTAINGYSVLALRRVGDDHPIASYLEEIKKAGDRAANLTRQLLAFGRKQILQPLSLNLNEVVNDMSKMLRRLIGENIDLVTKLSPDLKQIKADPGQVEQVLVNLVINARDAMPAGGTLTIETSNTQLDGAYASKHVGVNPGRYTMLAVSDTGIGMDQATQLRIFEPFFTTKEKGKGTGLGLSTVYGIVRQSGGNVWVYSEPQQGTSFKLYLPQIEAEAEASGVAAAGSVIKRGSETVLLVEDEDMVRNLATELLKENGYNVVEASGGEEAIRLSRSHKEPIHLLITDVVMPKMSGKDVARGLQVVHPEARVLFMSGYTDESIVHHGIVDSHIAFIQKPFSEPALMQKIRDVLDAVNEQK